MEVKRQNKRWIWQLLPRPLMGDVHPVQHLWLVLLADSPSQPLPSLVPVPGHLSGGGPPELQEAEAVKS